MRARAGGLPAVVLLLLISAPLAEGIGISVTLGPSERVILVLDGPLTSWERADLALSGVTVERELDVTPAIVARAPRTASFALESKPFVLRAQPVEPLEFHLERSRDLIRAHAPDWDLRHSGRGVTVAVIDSGLDVAHPDLEGRVAANVRYAAGRFLESAADGTGHGTHVASIVAGSGAASGGALRGVAPDARLVGVDISGAFDTAAALEAFDWLFVNRERLGVDVVVAAWGRQARGERFDPNDALVRATNRLVDDGVVVVFSASNHGPGASTLSLEAQNPRVITVGATDDAGVLARYSSRGPALDASGAPTAWVKPDVVAPGTRVLAAKALASPAAPAALPGLGALLTSDSSALRYTELTGTSQSAPHVAGVVALMLEANPRLTPEGVMNALRETAIDLGAPGPDAESGFGLVDARDAVLAAAGRQPDRGNVLVAGGEDAFAGAGRFLGLSSRGLQTDPVLQPAREDGYATLEFPIKPGASRVDLEFRWSPATSATFRVYLTNGERTLGPWSESERDGDARVVRAALDARDLPPGSWTLAARGTAAGDVQYAARAAVAVEPKVAAASGLDPRYRVPEPTADDGPLAEILHEIDVMWVRGQIWMRRSADWATENPVAGAALAFAASSALVGAAAAAVLLRRARAGPPEGPPPPLP